MNEREWDVIVVGAGVVGLSHAWAAAKRGKRVAIFERSPNAQGASVRNFGMIWPIGQPLGRLYQAAIRSRACWLEVAEQAEIWIRECGSLHLVYQADELAVVEEFIESEFGRIAGASWWDRNAVLKAAPAANPSGLKGALWSSSELGVNPRQAIARIPQWLAQQHDVDLRFGQTVTAVETNLITTANGARYRAGQILVCGGHDARSLFPDLYSKMGLFECKLQMMRTVSQPSDWRIGPHLAGGLTLQHYASFADCPSLPALKERIERETPELNRFGIHVMAAQNDAGQVILGDSHEYRADITPFDKIEIEQLMLRELRKLIVLPDWSLESRWHGVYAKHATKTIVSETPYPGVHVLLIPGGAGMTLSMGVADQFWSEPVATLTSQKLNSKTFDRPS